MGLVTLFKSGDQSFDLFQSRLKAEVDPVLSNLLIQGSQLPNISITSGVNVINHKLGRRQLGWVVTDINAAISIFRSQPFNDKTLTLTSNGACQLSLWVY